MPKLPRRNWPWALLTHALFLQIVVYIARPTAAYKALELDVSPALLGLIAASFTFLPMFLALNVGRETDRGRAGLILISGAALVLLGCAGLMLWSPSLILLLVWNVILGLGHLMSIIAEQSLVASGKAANFDKAFGLYTFVTSAGQAVGPLIVALVGGSRAVPDTTLLFATATAASVVLLASSTRLMTSHARDGAQRQARPSVSLKQALHLDLDARRQIFGAVGVSLAFIGAIDLLGVYLPAIGVDRGIAVSTVGLLLALRAVATMVSRLFLGLLVPRLGRPQLIIYSMVLGAASMGALALPLPVWAVGATVLSVGVAFGFSQPLTMTTVALTAPDGTRGTWLAIRMGANRVGQTGIPAGVGLFAAGGDSSGVFAATSVLLAAVSAGAWYALLHRSGR